MYLISIYFDAKTNGVMQRYINRIAEKTGNNFMTEKNVPPHITVSAFETKEEEQVILALERVVGAQQAGKISWVSVGQFFPYVLYLTPLLDEYLHQMSCNIFRELSVIPQTIINQYYRPFQWLPHATLGKKLTKEEMRLAFEVMQEQFEVFDGKVVAIGLAKTNPYREIVRYDLKGEQYGINKCKTGN